MNATILQTPIDYLKGVGPNRADLLRKELGIHTYQDLINLFPNRYLDRTKYYTINTLLRNNNAEVQVVGKITKFQEVAQKRGKRLVATFQDDTGTMELVWFRGQKWIKENLKLNKPYVVFGKTNWYNGKFSMPHPEMELQEVHEKSLRSALQPIYPSTEKLSNKGITNRVMGKIMQQLFLETNGKFLETLSEIQLKELKLISKKDALYNVHFPKNLKLLSRAQFRLKFEELFYIQLQLNNNELLSNGSIVYYEDLDNDGKSEKIISQLNDVGNASFLLYRSNGDFVDQFNFSTKFPRGSGFWFQDVDENGIKEIYTVTQSRDSAFLNILEPLGNISRKRIFIDTISANEGEYEFRSARLKSLYDLKIKNEDIVFTIMVGYAGNPRHVYKYDYFNNFIIKSPHLTNSSGFTHVMDIDNDGKNEILVTTNAPANDIDSIFTKRSDYSTWLTVLDDDLSFLFDPIEFSAIGSTQLMPFVEDGVTKLIVIFRSKKPNEMPSKLMQLSTSGIIEEESILPNNIYHYLYKIDEQTFGLHARIKGGILIFNNDLEQIDEYYVLPYDNVNYYDIDADGEKEWVNYHPDYNRITVRRKGFKDPVTIETSTETEDESNFGIKYINENKAQLFFQRGGINSIYDYRENPLYIYQYGVYAGIYGLVLGLVLLIVKGQKIQQEKKSAIEHEISTLQIKAVKNQVDPHFVFNAINTISEMTLMDNKLEADKFICRFSDFMRDTLQHSDKISTTLKEELEYTENFIKLQQIRFSHSFNYKINIAKNVGLNSLVPKHVLFCYAENAIKHGLALKEKGELLIGVKRKKGKLQLYIEDNGGGIRKSETTKKNSTGNGLLIMERVFELYTKLNKRKIEHQVIELFDDEKQKKGIRVEILISNAKNKIQS